jgi:hypothetical protein
MQSSVYREVHRRLFFLKFLKCFDAIFNLNEPRKAFKKNRRPLSHFHFDISESRGTIGSWNVHQGLRSSTAACHLATEVPGRKSGNPCWHCGVIIGIILRDPKMREMPLVNAALRCIILAIWNLFGASLQIYIYMYIYS